MEMQKLTAEYGDENDIVSWMELVHTVSKQFPGLETEESINEHKCTVLKFMNEQRAICVKDNNRVVGVLLLDVYKRQAYRRGTSVSWFI